MSKRDTYHTAVREALIKDGWIITHDPLTLPFGSRNVYIDLGAEAPFAAERNGRKIAVEVKTFLGTSEVTELERALGQFSLYDFLLQQADPKRTLFLALPLRAYEELFDSVVGQQLIVVRNLCLLVFEPQDKEIKKWIEPDGQR